VYVVGESLSRNLGYGGLSGEKFFFRRGLAGGRFFELNRSSRRKGKIFYISRYCLRMTHSKRGSCGALCVCGFSLFHSRCVIIDTWKGGLRVPSGCALVMRNLSFLTIPLIGVRYD